MVVVHVAVAAADAFGLFDDPVEPFGSGVRRTLGEGHEDGGPPRLDGVREPGGLGHVRVWYASATRCHLSTAIRTPGRAARIPDAQGADGSMTTSSIAARNAGVCTPSQSFTQPPVRPGANPSKDLSPLVEQSTNEVSHGSDRRHVTPSRSHRTDRNRVSSIPSRLVGAGSGNHFAAAAINALCAVGPDTWYSPATSETARFPGRDRPASLSRSRSLTLARGGSGPRPDRPTCLGKGTAWAPRFTTDQTPFPPPQLSVLAAGRQVLDPPEWSVFHPAGEHPARRAQRLHRPASLDDDVDLLRTGPVEAYDVELVLNPEQH